MKSKKGNTTSGSHNEKNEPIIWESKNQIGPLNDFLKVAQGIGHTHVIYVQDAAGENKSVWACGKTDIIECFEIFSEKCYFGRIQPIQLAITFGFDDEDFTNEMGYGDITN